MSSTTANPKNIVIFGGTGQTGRELVKQSLELGHHVRVLARNADKAKTLPDAVEVQLGDAKNADDVEKALEGQDVVLCSVGGQSISDSTSRSEITQLIVSHMKAKSISRLIVCSVVGIGESANHLGWFSRMITGIFLKHAMNDHRAQEQIIVDSGLEYVIIRPPQLVNGPLTKSYRTATEHESFRASKVSRADVAHAMLSAIEDSKWLGACVSISA